MENQPSLRTEILSNLCDAIDKGDDRGASIGKRIILPASFTGNPRYMMQHFSGCYGHMQMVLEPRFVHYDDS